VGRCKANLATGAFGCDRKRFWADIGNVGYGEVDTDKTSTRTDAQIQMRSHCCPVGFAAKRCGHAFKSGRHAEQVFAAQIATGAAKLIHRPVQRCECVKPGINERPVAMIGLETAANQGTVSDAI